MIGNVIGRRRSAFLWQLRAPKQGSGFHLVGLTGFAKLDEASEHWAIAHAVTNRPVTIMEKVTLGTLERFVIIREESLAKIRDGSSDMWFESLCAAVDMAIFKTKKHFKEDLCWREHNFYFDDVLNENMESMPFEALSKMGYATLWGESNQMHQRLRELSSYLEDGATEKQIETMAKSLKLIHRANKGTLRIRNTSHVTD